MKSILNNTADFVPKKIVKWFQNTIAEKDVTLIKYPNKYGGFGYINIAYKKESENGLPIFEAGSQGEDIGYLEACGTLKIYGKKIIEYGTN